MKVNSLVVLLVGSLTLLLHRTGEVTSSPIPEGQSHHHLDNNKHEEQSSEENAIDHTHEYDSQEHHKEFHHRHKRSLSSSLAGQRQPKHLRLSSLTRTPFYHHRGRERVMRRDQPQPVLRREAEEPVFYYEPAFEPAPLHLSAGEEEPVKKEVKKKVDEHRPASELESVEEDYSVEEDEVKDSPEVEEEEPEQSSTELEHDEDEDATSPADSGEELDDENENAEEDEEDFDYYFYT